RLLLGGVREDDAACGRLLLVYRLDDQSIAERLELHSENLRLVQTDWSWHSSNESASCQGLFLGRKRNFYKVAGGKWQLAGESAKARNPETAAVKAELSGSSSGCHPKRTL